MSKRPFPHLFIDTGLREGLWNNGVFIWSHKLSTVHQVLVWTCEFIFWGLHETYFKLSLVCTFHKEDVIRVYTMSKMFQLCQYCQKYYSVTKNFYISMCDASRDLLRVF